MDLPELIPGKQGLKPSTYRFSYTLREASRANFTLTRIETDNEDLIMTGEEASKAIST